MHKARIIPPDIRKALKKTAWLARNRRIWEFFCSNCKRPRRLATPRQPLSPWAVFQLVLATAFFMLATWPLWGWKGVILFLPLAAVYETVYRLKVRAMMECPHCGFDPYLYVTDVQSARREIETFWRRKFEEKGVPFPDPKAPPSSPASASDLPSADS